jgi:hypothetical protein
MNRITFPPLLALALGAFLLLSACGGSEAASEHGHAHAAPDSHSASSSAPASISPDQTKQLVQAYLSLKDALVQSDAKLAKEAAKEVVSATGESQELATIRTHAQGISEGETLDAQREHFNQLSEEVYELAKANGVSDMPLYKQYCPMAFDKAGAFWLAAEKEVNNPYFGDMMLHCGSVQEEL